MSEVPTIQNRQFVQPGLGTTETKEGGELKSLWIKLPAWCDLFCPYCFASARRVDYDKDNLLSDEYFSILKSFADMKGSMLMEISTMMETKSWSCMRFSGGTRI